MRKGQALKQLNSVMQSEWLGVHHASFSVPRDRTAMNASCGTLTVPIDCTRTQACQDAARSGSVMQVCLLVALFLLSVDDRLPPGMTLCVIACIGQHHGSPHGEI